MFRVLTRRTLLGGAACVVSAATLEYFSLSGAFDHRRLASSKTDFGKRKKAATKTGGCHVIHVGHSTHLLVVDGKSILTDPWFYDPSFGALQHRIPPAAKPSEIGQLDFIFVSHDHPDHADMKALDQLDKTATVVVGTRELEVSIHKLGFRVERLAPWGELTVGSLKLAAVPGFHDVPEIGLVASGAGKSIYFAGDTAWRPELEEIGRRFVLDLAILPVDGLRLRTEPLMVMGPREALHCAWRLNAKRVMPSHDDASFSDLFAEHVLTSRTNNAKQLFRKLMKRKLPEVPCWVPEPADHWDLGRES